MLIECPAMRNRRLWLCLTGALLAAPMLRGQSYMCEDRFHLEEEQMACYRLGPDAPPPPAPVPLPEPPKLDPFQLRLLKYTAATAKHKVAGLASYYSRSLEGTLTANGEHY